MAQPIMNLWMIASIGRNEQKGVLIVGIPSPLSPIPLPFSLPPYPLSMPAMQASFFSLSFINICAVKCGIYSRAAFNQINMVA